MKDYNLKRSAFFILGELSNYNFVIISLTKFISIFRDCFYNINLFKKKCYYIYFINIFFFTSNSIIMYNCI